MERITVRIGELKDCIRIQDYGSTGDLIHLTSTNSTQLRLTITGTDDINSYDVEGNYKPLGLKKIPSLQIDNKDDKNGRTCLKKPSKRLPLETKNTLQ